MDKTQDIEQGVLHYLASVGPTVGRTFGIRDFNTQVMMNAFSAQERDGLQPALDALVVAGILLRVSATDYRVTAEGTRVVQARKRPLEPRSAVAPEGLKCS